MKVVFNGISHFIALGFAVYLMDAPPNHFRFHSDEIPKLIDDRTIEFKDSGKTILYRGNFLIEEDS
jgi:hypothetical protein